MCVDAGKLDAALGDAHSAPYWLAVLGAVEVVI